MRLKLRNGGETEIDDADFEKVFKLEVWPGQVFEFRVCDYTWRHKDHERLPYVQAVTSRGGRQCCIKLHRLIAGAKVGQDVDHIDHNVLNNKKSNLRVCSRLQNNRSRRRHSRKNGVYTNPLTGEQIVRSFAGGKEKLLPKVG